MALAIIVVGLTFSNVGIFIGSLAGLLGRVDNKAPTLANAVEERDKFSEFDGGGPTTVACGSSETKLAEADSPAVVATKALTTGVVHAGGMKESTVRLLRVHDGLLCSR